VIDPLKRPQKRRCERSAALERPCGAGKSAPGVIAWIKSYDSEMRLIFNAGLATVYHQLKLVAKEEPAEGRLDGHRISAGFSRLLLCHRL
jgi:hypothetical protein